MTNMSDKNKALDKLIRYVTTRDHSVKELRDKLGKHFSLEQVEQAIEHADKHGFLIPPKELSWKVASRLNSKYKGGRYINQYLSTKGLPEVKIEEDLELSKARELVKRKFSKSESNLNEWSIHKIFRFLYSQGYDRNIARRIAHEEL